MAFYLTIVATQLVPPLCTVLNLEELLSEADQRGSDRVIPGSAGVLPQVRRRTVTRHVLQLVIRGTSYTGTQTNLMTLRALAAPTGTGDGTRACTITMPDATTLTANVHVGPLTVGKSSRVGRNLLATLDISIPAGRFI